MSGQWIDGVHARRPQKGTVLDMDSSVSPTHGEQGMSVWNGHYESTAIIPGSSSTNWAELPKSLKNDRLSLGKAVFRRCR
jgi:hypothetical protein